MNYYDSKITNPKPYELLWFEHNKSSTSEAPNQPGSNPWVYKQINGFY